MERPGILPGPTHRVLSSGGDVPLVGNRPHRVLSAVLGLMSLLIPVFQTPLSSSAWHTEDSLPK